VWYGFIKLVHSIVKCGNNQNASLTPDKEVNILIHRMPLCIITYGSYKHLKIVQFFWLTLYKDLTYL